MKYIKYLLIILLGPVFFFAPGCKKYLDFKADKNLVVISSLDDMQALFDDFSTITQGDPGSGEISSDDYYLTSEDWSALNETFRRMYIWEKDFLFPASYNEWLNTYRKVYYANTVLEHLLLHDRTEGNHLTWDNLKGQAYFFRAEAFLQTAIIWTLAYDENTARTDLGIPLRLTTDFNEKSVRSNVEETYAQITEDLRHAISYLPLRQLQVTRPSKQAAYGLMARTYLAMREYDSCKKYTDLCLQEGNLLMDYNNAGSPDNVDLDGSTPFQQFNLEIIFESIIPNPRPLGAARAKIDSTLYRLYDDNDLRKRAFFRDNGNGSFGFKGRYSLGPFGGIATDEIFLMRAECLARKGATTDAMNDLNTLMLKRWDNSVTFPVFTASSPEHALSLILIERRKELVMRGLRWMDIKRLNKEGANISLSRIVNNQRYILPANDLRFALPIPEDVIALSGMQQNPR